MCPSLAEPDLGGFPKNYSCNVSCETMLLENHSNPVRQNRFAVCLCAVRRWLRCPNCLWMFLRLQFFWIFYAFRMANSSFFASLRFLLLLIIHSLQGSACPLHPSPSWASSTAVACGSLLADNLVYRLFPPPPNPPELLPLLLWPPELECSDSTLTRETWRVRNWSCLAPYCTFPDGM